MSLEKNSSEAEEFMADAKRFGLPADSSHYLLWKSALNRAGKKETVVLGWRIVPHKPTQEMLNAAYKCAFECDGEHFPQTIRLSDDEAETLYQAMVKAAP